MGSSCFGTLCCNFKISIPRLLFFLGIEGGSTICIWLLTLFFSFSLLYSVWMVVIFVRDYLSPTLVQMFLISRHILLMNWWRKKSSKLFTSPKVLVYYKLYKKKKQRHQLLTATTIFTVSSLSCFIWYMYNTIYIITNVYINTIIILEALNAYLYK